MSHVAGLVHQRGTLQKEAKGWEVFVEVRGGSKIGPGEDQSPRAGKNAVGKINHKCAPRDSGSKEPANVGQRTKEEECQPNQ